MGRSDQSAAMELTPVTEFYISSNPPLQPTGVGQVMDLINGWDYNGLILEILYEPEVPWFKVLTLVRDQSEVAATVQGFVSKVVDGCSLADRPFEDANTGTLFDAIPSQQVIPWASFPLSYGRYVTTFDKYKYPKDMQVFGFKTTWRELLQTPGCTIETLFKLPSEWHCIGFPQSLENLKELLQCYISYNLGETTLYIGNNIGQQAIDKAVNTTNNLLQTAISISNRKHHLIYVDDENNMKFVYKLLSHIGLSKTTFAPSSADENECRRVRTAVSIRAAKVQDDGNWMSDSKKYPSRSALRSDKIKPFSPFNGHNYKAKVAESVSRLVKEAEQLIRGGHPIHSHTEANERPGSLFASGSDYRSSDKSTPPTEPNIQDLPQIVEIQNIDLQSRLSPRFPHKSDDLISFDENIGNIDQKEEYDSFKMQPPSLLDDNPPFELIASTPLDKPMVAPMTVESKPHSNNSSGKAQNSHPIPTSSANVPGKTTPIGGPRRGLAINSYFEEHMESLMSTVQFIPGYVSIRLKFGRFYITDLGPAEVDVGCGPYRNMDKILESLEAETQSTNLHFSTIISTIGPDADTIVGTSAPIDMWVRPNVEIQYRIECSFQQKTFIVDIDGDTFDFTCHGPSFEMDSIIVHCPRHAWDMKVCADRSKNLDLSPIHRILGEIVVKSLHVLSHPNDKKLVELTANDSLGMSIEGVTILYLARYLHINTNDSTLTVQFMEKLSPGEARSGRRRWTAPKRAKDNQPNAWYEAYISSSRIDKVLKDNATMSVGDKSSWSPGDLASYHLFFNIYNPALKMISVLDEVGKNNDNGQQEIGNARLTFVDSLTEAAARRGRPYAFW